MIAQDADALFALLTEIRDLLRVIVYGNSEKKDAGGGCCKDK